MIVLYNLRRIYAIKYLSMAQILKKFRDLMALKKINVYVLPRTDEHQVLAFAELELISL